MMDARPLADDPLALVQRFVNSTELLDVPREDLDSPGALAAWLRANGLPAPARPTAADLRRAQDVREALRAVLGAHAGGPADPVAAAVLNRAVERAGLRPLLGASGAITVEATVHAPPLDAALGQLLTVAAAAAADGSWGRLKTCANPDCRWAFYDRSRNHAGRWCEMATCGARHKMRSYRARAGGRTPPTG